MPKKRVARRSPTSARVAPAPIVELPLDDPMRLFRVALVISIILHGIVLSIRFKLPEVALSKLRDPQLEVVLVNAKSATKPVDPQARAQANLDGGGNVDENRRAKTPLPALPQRESGTEIMTAQARPAEPEVPQPKMVTPVPAPAKVTTVAQPEPQPERTQSVSGVDLARSALAMARMEAQIARRIDEYNKRPRKKFVGARVTEAVEAQYVEDWRQKVERVGNLNYPESARGRLYGNLVLSVGIRSDGEIDTVEVNRPSGHKVLDDAAVRIVRLAGPYGPFPPALKRNVDILVITRTWTFTSADQLLSD